jgi:N6-L-threonylcarbamoyladenine synthase
MNILAIDTSCDDTCISILEVKNGRFNLKSNIVSSQIKIHQKYGGVYPALAKREHQKNLMPVLKQALKKAKLLKVSKNQKPDINAIAVTIGPGLDPCLWMGVNFAKALSYFWQVPIIPVNHIEGHILANFLTKTDNNFQKSFPAICLIVSGGHTQLILMKGIGNYKIIGETRDDAAGECFDKTARILGLSYPGGPAIASEAERISTVQCKLQIKLPRPMINSKDYDFSFSGLKTAVLYDFKK